MTIEEYVESFGFTMNECTPGEIQEAKKELRGINRGMIILDGVLSRKIILPENPNEQ